MSAPSIMEEYEMVDQDPELTPEQAGKLMGVSDETVKRRIHAGKIKARLEGPRYRIKKSEVLDYLRRTEYRPQGQQEEERRAKEK